MRRKEELEEEGTENENEVERNNATTKGGVRADKMEKLLHSNPLWRTHQTTNTTKNTTKNTYTITTITTSTS